MRPFIALIVPLLCVTPWLPVAARASVDEGVRLFEAGRLDEAKKALAPAASASPGNVTAALYMGRIGLREDSPDAARWFEKALALEPANATCHLWLGRAYGRKAQKASVIHKTGHAKKARLHFEKAIELDPNLLEARMDMMEYYLQAPGFLGGSADKARAEAAEIARRSPWRGHHAAARIAEHEKDHAGAERAYKAAVAAIPDSSSATVALGLFYARRERWDDAFAAYDAFLRRAPDDAGVLYQVGRAGALSGRQLERAERALLRYLEITPRPDQPDHASAHWRLGIVYQKQGRKDLARKAYESALALSPDHEAARKALGRLK